MEVSCWALLRIRRSAAGGDAGAAVLLCSSSGEPSAMSASHPDDSQSVIKSGSYASHTPRNEDFICSKSPRATLRATLGHYFSVSLVPSLSLSRSAAAGMQTPKIRRS